MSWFKVGDRVHAHPKVLAAGNSALGLWTRCGSWSSDHLTDGFVPTEIVKNYGSRRDRERLLLVGMLEPGTHGQYGAGYLVHDYLECNPSRLTVLAERAKTARRKADWKARHGGQEQLWPDDDGGNAVPNGATTRHDTTRQTRITSVDRQTTTRGPINGRSSVDQILTASANAIASKAGRADDTRYLNGIRRNLEAERLEEITTMLESTPPLEVVASIAGSKVHARAALRALTNGDQP